MVPDYMNNARMIKLQAMWLSGMTPTEASGVWGSSTIAVMYFYNLWNAQVKDVEVNYEALSRSSH